MLDKTSFPYGVGFRSLTEETPEPVSLKVDGALPSWLEGALLRSGPSKFEVGARTYNHWFDGLAMLHRCLRARPRELHEPLPQKQSVLPPPKPPARSLTASSPPIPAALCSA